MGFSIHTSIFGVTIDSESGTMSSFFGSVLGRSVSRSRARRQLVEQLEGRALLSNVPGIVLLYNPPGTLESTTNTYSVGVQNYTNKLEAYQMSVSPPGAVIFDQPSGVLAPGASGSVKVIPNIVSTTPGDVHVYVSYNTEAPELADIFTIASVTFGPKKGTISPHIRTPNTPASEPDNILLGQPVPEYINVAPDFGDSGLSVTIKTIGLTAPTGAVKIDGNDTYVLTSSGTVSLTGTTPIAPGRSGSWLTGGVALVFDVGGPYSGDEVFYSSNFSVVPIIPLSFAKDSASNPSHSNGDYDFTYQVGNTKLSNNPKLTVAAYWATGTTVASIIPNLPPVAISQLPDLTPGTHTFGLVHIADLEILPANARASTLNLIAVLDNNRVFSSSKASNTTIPLSTQGAQTGYSTLNEPISGELASAPSEPTRYEEVRQWLVDNASTIVSYAKATHVNRIAIAGAIAWEALQNVKPLSAGVVDGPGKPHFYVTDASAVENPKKYGYFLPYRTLLLRGIYLDTTNGAIQYIAAIMNAYAVDATSIGINLRGLNAGGILASYYNGVTPNELGIPLTLLNAPQYFALRVRTLSPTNPLTPNATMGQWVSHNVAYLEEAVGTPPANGY